MAITGVSAISGEQIIAAGAVSARAAATASYTTGGNNLQGLYDTVSNNSGSWTGGPVYTGDAQGALDEVYTNSGTWNTVTNKLDTTAFSTVSGNFLTAHQALPDSANWNSTYNTVSVNSGSWSSRPQEPVSGINIDIFESAGTVVFSGMSGGGSVPEGVMVESGLEYNAVNEISGYSGSAFAQYGAEKQWLQHDDTLLHVANSAQYALGVNVSAVAQLLGIDETLLWSGAEGVTTAFELNEAASSFNKVRYEWKWNNGVDASTMNTVLNPDSTFFTLFSIGTTTSNNNKYYTVGRFIYDSTYENLTYQSGWQGNNAVPTTATTMERFIRIQKIVGIGRKEV